MLLRYLTHGLKLFFLIQLWQGVSCSEEKMELRVFSTERGITEFESQNEIIVTQKHLNKQ